MATTVDVVFTVAILGAATLPAHLRTKVICVLIIIYPILASALSIWKLVDGRTWHRDPTATQDTLYRTSVVRSSAFYVICNILLFGGAKLFGLRPESSLYSFLSLAGLTIIAYWYDRLISSHDGYDLLIREPAKAISYAFMSYSSPAFARFLVVLLLEIVLSLCLAHFLGKSLAPGLAATILKQTIVPIIVFAVVTGPLRFRWAYPTVCESFRISYLTPYIMAFVSLSLVAVVSSILRLIFSHDSRKDERKLDMLDCIDRSLSVAFAFMLFIAVLMQLCGCSEAGASFSLNNDATRFPWPVMLAFAFIIVVSVLVIVFRIFHNNITPLLAYSAAETAKSGVEPCGLSVRIFKTRITF